MSDLMLSRLTGSLGDWCRKGAGPYGPGCHAQTCLSVPPGAWLLVVTGLLVGAICLPLPGAEPPTFKFAGGQGEFQALLDRVPIGAVVVCEQAEPLVVTKTLTITKPLTLRGLRARLPEKLGGMTLLVVKARDVVLADLEMHGNYDSVDQKDRAPFIHFEAGGFRVERCRFFDGSKDGLNVTPRDGAGDIVGGVIRDIEGVRMGRDVVSISGGCGGQRVRDVIVENVRLQKGYFRGAVEVSDGTDHITVRHVRAEEAVYALDVQDHGAVQKGKAQPSAPNTNVVAEDVTAVNCRHVIRTANHPLGHANLTLRNLTARNCRQPVLISNTRQVRVEGLTIVSEPRAKGPPITLRNCQDVALRNVRIVGLPDAVEAVDRQDSTDVRIEELMREPGGEK
jgi:hypothetical protein